MNAGLRFLAVFAIISGLLSSVQAAPTAVNLTLQSITWNVIGLDSNDVNAGPNLFPVAVRVCNTGSTEATNVSATFTWDSTNSLIDLLDPNKTTLIIPMLAASSCTDFYYTVVISRTSAAYNTTRRFHITVGADGVAPMSSPIPRELYVEKLISQNRNATLSIQSPNYDPATNTSYFALGETYQITVTSKTATGGYEQLEVFFGLPYTMFEIIAVQTGYTAPSGSTNSTMYADACGWQNNPSLPDYRSCIGPNNYAGGKAGGNPITTVYTVRTIATGTSIVGNLIYDFSGSSYHYNDDLANTRIFQVLTPTAVTMTSITAASRTDGILVRWSTSAEENTIGFLVYRTVAGMQPTSGAVALNQTPIPANGIASKYHWLDQTAQSGIVYDYWIEALDADGTTQLYGPASAQARYRLLLPLVLNQP